MKLTREQAIELAGIENVLALDEMNCEPTSRLIYPAFEPEHAGMAEYSAYCNGLEAFYFQPEDMEDPDNAEWKIEYYKYDGEPVDVSDFHVYLCTPVESADMCSGSKEDCMEYIYDEIKGETPLNPRDTDNGNNHWWLELYHGEVVIETDDDCIFNEPIYVTKKYYNR